MCIRDRPTTSTARVRHVAAPQASRARRARRRASTATGDSLPRLVARKSSWPAFLRTRRVVQLLTARHHDLLDLGHVGSVLEAIADDGDDVPRLERIPVPSAGRRIFLARGADSPLLDGPVGLDVERDHHVRVGPDAVSYTHLTLP